MNTKQAFSERLIKAMTEAGYEPRPGVLERGFNTRYYGESITFQAAARWLQGKSIPKPDKLEVIAEWLGVEPQVLLFGEAVRASIKKRRQRWDDAITGQDKEVLQAFIELPPEEKKVARRVILALTNEVAAGKM